MKKEMLPKHWLLTVILTCVINSQSAFAEQAFDELFRDGYPDGGIVTDVKGSAHSWQKGLEERALSGWVPDRPLETNVQIQATPTDEGRLYDLEFVTSSGDGQSDADCLQALLGAAAYEPTKGIVRGGCLVPWDFKFNRDSQSFHENAAEYGYFKEHPKLDRNNTVVIFKIPTDVLMRYPGRFAEAEIIAPANLFSLSPAWRDDSRPKDKCGALRPQAMYSIIDHYAKWQKFFFEHPKASKLEILRFSEVLEET